MARGNSVCIAGNLTGDPKFHTFDSGTTKATIQVAVNEDRKKDDGSWESIPHYVEVEIWAGGVTIIRKFKKGNLVTVFGRLTWRKWEQDGQQREKLYVTAESIFGDHMYDKSDGSEPQSSGNQGGAPRTRDRGASSDQASAPRTRGDAPQPDAQPAALNEADDPGDDDVPWN